MNVLGVLSIVPIALLLVAGVVEQVPLFPIAVSAAATSATASIGFAVIGFQRGYPMMLLWTLSFVLLMPFSNLVFWAWYRAQVEVQ